jgi:hypothetical protein
MSISLPFTQARVRRAVKAVESAGLRVRRITFNPDGSFTFESETGTPEEEKPALASWEDV